MHVWLLRTYSDFENIVGVYTYQGKVKKNEQLFAAADKIRSDANTRLSLEVSELTSMSKTLIDESEQLLVKENTEKDAGDFVAMKATRKQRKAILKQVDQFTYKINTIKEKIQRSKLLTTGEVISEYGAGCNYYWECHTVIED